MSARFSQRTGDDYRPMRVLINRIYANIRAKDPRRAKRMKRATWRGMERDRLAKIQRGRDA